MRPATRDVGRPRHAFVDALALGLLTGILARESMALSRIAGSVPRNVLLITLALIAMQLVLDVRQRPPRAQGSTTRLADTADQIRPTVSAIAWLGSLVALVTVLGTALGASVFCLAFLRSWARESWGMAFLYSLAVGVGLLAIFGGLLGATLLSGWLPVY